jgi:hypothetical protein
MAATYPKTGSVLDATTRTGLSTQIVITVNGEPVGAVQNFSETQSKTVRRVGEVGTDGFIELVPQTPTTVSLELERVVFDGLSLTESLSRSWRNITSQRIPFDIEVIDQFTGTDKDAVVTTYKNCWFERTSKSYASGDYVIVERATVAAEYIFSVRAGQAVHESQGVGGARDIPTRQIDSSGVEAAADTGNRRGALDAAGIISAAY